MKTKKLAILSLLTAVSLMLSYLETLIPPIIPVPGIKIGLSNVVTVFLLYEYSFKEASLVSFVRIFISSLLFGSLMSFFYSLVGAVLSILVMTLFMKFSLSTKVSVSVLGGVFHNIGQVLVAIILLKTKELIFYLPVLLISGILTGMFIGLLSFLLMRILEKIRK